jgi:V-type H+-transporting ATPase subunit d
MSQVLAFEADRRTINITINSFGTELSKEQRAKLFPSIGNLWPAGNNTLAKSDELDQVKSVCDNVAQYRAFFDSSSTGAGGQDDDDSIASKLEERFFNMEVHINKLSFLSQFQYGVFYSYIKLKEQEIRNITWIAECIAQDARERIQDYITIF